MVGRMEYRMKKHNIIQLILPISMVLILSAGWILFFVGYEMEMAGLSSDAQKPELNMENILSGDYQVEAETYFNEQFPLRNIGIRAKNTIDATLFRKSPNDNLEIGYDNVLYEKEYIYNYLITSSDLGGEAQYNNIENIIIDLKYIQNELEKSGKDAVVFITPSKAYMDSSSIPLKYRLIATGEESRTYDVLVDLLDEYQIPYFDSYEYYQNNLIDVSLFPKSGIHWRMSAATYSIEAFSEMFNQTALNEIPYVVTQEPIVIEDKTQIESIDKDIYSLMNTYSFITDDYFLNDEYYHGNNHELEFDTFNEIPSISLQGGSFVEPFQHVFMYSNYIDDMIIISNNVFVDKVDGVTMLDTYAQVDMEDYLQSDVFIFEVNQAVGARMSFGFIAELRAYIEKNGVPENEEEIAGATKETAVFNYGLYDDGWVAPEMQVEIAVGAEGIVSVSGYYPGEIHDELTINVLVGNLSHSYAITSNNFSFDIPADMDGINKLTFSSQFEYTPTNTDERALAFVLSDISSK